MDTFTLSNQVRLGIPQALLLLYRYLTGIYALGDLSFVQFLAGYLGGKNRSLDGCRVLTVSGNGIGELEKALCLQWRIGQLETMSVNPAQMRILRLMMEASPDEIAAFFAWAQEKLRGCPNLRDLLSSPGLEAYWKEQRVLWQSPELTGRVRLFSGSPWNVSSEQEYDAIFLSHSQRLFVENEGKSLCSLLKPRGILAALMPVIFHPADIRGRIPLRFSDLPVVREAKEKMRNEARCLGYELPEDGPVNIRWTLGPEDILHYVSFSIASPLRSLLIGELLIQTLAFELPEAVRESLLESALDRIPPGAGAGTETLLILLAEKRIP
jgi:hypothetical protein